MIILDIHVPTSPMRREESKQWFLDYCKQIEKQSMLKKEILADNQYMEWIKHFVSEYGFFDTLLSETDDVSLKDASYLSRLGVLFHLLESYASRRYISSLEDENGRSYFLRYDDVVYQVGVDVSRENVYFCVLGGKNVDASVIFSFDAVQKEAQEMDSNVYVREELKGLSSYIQTLKSSGFTDQDIIETTALALRLIKL